MNFVDKFWHSWLRRPHKLAKGIDSGKGKTVLLIHGLGTDSTAWEPLVSHMDLTEWHVVGFDLLGFGRSPKPRDNSYDVSEHARAILTSLGRRKRSKKIIIIGHSMGCLIASHIARLKPGMVERLILYEPPLFADSPEFRSHARRRELYFSFYEQLIKRPQILLKYGKLLSRVAEGRLPDVSPRSWMPFERSLKNTIMKQTAYDELKTVRVPTDIIYGKFDFIVTRKEVKDMLKANPNVRFHMVNEMHDITNRASKYIVRLLGKPQSDILLSNA